MPVRAWFLSFTFATSFAFIVSAVPAMAAPCDIAIPGDFDGDGDVDHDDFSIFAGCATRATVPQANSSCLVADFDHDNDVDMRDFGTWQLLITGPGTCGPYLKEP